jgi:WS/DGAT/MGAT family acyltransferase
MGEFGTTTGRGGSVRVGQLGVLDTGLAYGETPSWYMHAGALIELDPTTAGRVVDAERIREVLAARLQLMEPLRRRLVPVPLGLDRPFWADLEDVDLRDHVHHVRVPAPGGREELGSTVGTLLAGHLDHDRPLWKVWLLEGLERGRVALLVKAHHSLFDGAMGVRLFELLYDLAPDASDTRGPLDGVSEFAPPSRLDLWGRALTGTVTVPLRAARLIRRLGETGLRMVRFRASEDWPDATFPFQAPRTSMNGSLSPRRGFAFCSIPMDDALRVKQAVGVTLNDVVLGTCAGALTRYLAERGEVADRPLIAQVPLALDHDDGAHRLQGNALSVMGASLATDIADPRERLLAIHRSTRSAKAMHHALGEDILSNLADPVPPVVLGASVRAYAALRLVRFHPPVFSLIVSTVRGPPCPVYVAGARVVGTYPIGPLLDGGGLNVTAISCDDSLDFGFAVCPELVPDPWRIADAATDAFAELCAAVGER